MVVLTLLHFKSQAPHKQWFFEDEPLIRIGRAPDNHIVLSDSLVSRHHLELRRTEHGNLYSSWQLINRGKNGTFLNGILVAQGLLLDGALIQLAQGGPILKFQLQATTTQSHLAAPPTLQRFCNHTRNSPTNLFCIDCGQPIRIERSIRQYQILRTLGQGGMGTTYLAWDSTQAIAPSMPRSVGFQASTLRVLKELNTDMAEITKAQELFTREARILRTLSHPGIPKFFDFFTASSKRYLVMELIQGEDLEKWVYQRGPVSMQQAIIWILQVCEVLDYLHRQSPPIIHRDIKPANLMVRRQDNRIVVLDFGAVKETGTPWGTRIGAEGYSAPEQEIGRPVTQSDLYAVGPTLMFLLTGESPYKFYDKQNGEYRLSPERILTITPSLQSIIRRVTAPQSRDRYQTAQDLMQALRACLPCA